MNSDEARTHERDRRQEPAVDAFEEQQPDEDLEEERPKVVVRLADSDDPWQDSVSVSDAGLSDPALDVTNVEAQPVTSQLVQPVENEDSAALAQTVAELKRQEQELRQKISILQETQAQILSEQLAKTQAAMERLVQEGVQELEQRKQALQISIEQLERRRERIRAEMRTTFAGVSQELAIRVQGFKDYLVGSLQDLASTAEQLELTPASDRKSVV